METHIRNGVRPLSGLCLVAAFCLMIGTLAMPAPGADSNYLYGIHWWPWNGSLPIDTTAATMLDCPTYGGWDVESILTHSSPWWGAAWFTGLYAQLYTNQNMTIITRIDYNWGETVPAPTNPDYAGWPNACVNVVNTLKDYCHIWIIGNEPNVTLEGNGWPGNHIDPAGYATIYRNVRNAIHASAQTSPAGEHIVCIAAPSPGGAAGVRWMGGNDWLGQVIDNVPNNEIDGIALHAYGFDVSDFHAGYSSQVNLIDSKGLNDIPLYITEWNVPNPSGVPSDSHEASCASNVGAAFADLNAWNQTVGNHNIRCLCWFVYDSKGWDYLSIDYYRTHNNPPGPNDLYTRFAEAVDQRYPAGIVGTNYGGPIIELLPTGFTRQIIEGDPLASDVFTVTNVGNDTLNYNISDNVSWLSVTPSSGSSAGEPDPITINYSPESLAIGHYDATITVSSGNAANSPQLIAIGLDVIKSPYAPFDFNRDGYVNQVDYSVLAGCMTGPNLGPPDPGCENADVDGDDDIDLDDFGKFQICMTAGSIPADPDCAD